VDQGKSIFLPSPVRDSNRIESKWPLVSQFFLFIGRPSDRVVTPNYILEMDFL
jgi:hypothetical protein